MVPNQLHVISALLYMDSVSHDRSLLDLWSWDWTKVKSFINSSLLPMAQHTSGTKKIPEQQHMHLNCLKFWTMRHWRLPIHRLVWNIGPKSRSSTALVLGISQGEKEQATKGSHLRKGKAKCVGYVVDCRGMKFTSVWRYSPSDCHGNKNKIKKKKEKYFGLFCLHGTKFLKILFLKIVKNSKTNMTTIGPIKLSSCSLTDNEHGRV